MPLTQIFIHPLKSCRGIESGRAFAGFSGFLHDREWLLATEDGGFISARTDPVLLTVSAEPWPGMMLFRAPGRPPIAACETRYTEAVAAEVWGDAFSAWHGDAALDAWFGALLGKPCRLLWLGAQSKRLRSQLEHPVSFADGYPYLLTNQASLAALNSELATPVSMRHFRPNLVVDGFAPWAEDQWKTLRIGAVVFDVAKPCARCVLTTLHPDSGQRSRDSEPLRLLGKRRRIDGEVLFGLNLVARTQGLINVNDAVEILA
ncbi:MOSC domain-containing protein [Rhodobacteraceae bacterium CH30]|nr:MOSC domain-containing protein [Rhodobacteraceae bacterium CH30]